MMREPPHLAALSPLRETAANLAPRGLFAKAAVAALMGAGIGVASAYLAVRDGFAFGAARSGPWSAWPKIGAPDIDPYARARLARSGAVALGAGEGLTFRAHTDSEGQALDGGCDYIVSGPIPAARFWTLSAATREGAPISNAAQRHAFVSSDVLRAGDGSVQFVVAPSARAGNWLPAPRGQAFMLSLALYDTTFAASAAAVEGVELPDIRKGACS